MELEKRICRLIADVFEIRPEKITINSSSETVEEWDSLGQLQVVMSIEKEFGIRFKTDELSKLNSVEKLAKRIKTFSRT